MVDSSLNQLDKKRTILKWVFFGLAIGLSLFLIINGCINGEKSGEESDTISHAMADVINTVSPNTITTESFPTFAFINRKVLGHFLAFTVNAVFASISAYYFLVVRKWYKHYIFFGVTMMYGFVVALLSEMMQLFAQGRVASFLDVGIDMGGYLLGVLIIFIILFFMKKLDPYRQKNTLKFCKKID